MDSVKVRLSSGRQFIGWDSAGHSTVMDAAAAYSGEGSGTRPLELFLEALAGCTAMDIASILEKKRQDFRGLEIHVEADQRDEQPKIYTEIRLRYVVTGYGVDPKAVERAIELSEEKYCSVKGMLGPQVRVVTSFEVREGRPCGVPLKSKDGDH